MGLDLLPPQVLRFENFDGCMYVFYEEVEC